MTNIEVIKAYYNAFNEQDYEKMLSLLSEDIKHGINEGSIVSGKSAFRKFLARMDHHYQEQVKELQVLQGEDSSRMAAEFKIDGIYKETDEGLPEANGQSYYISVGAFFDVKDGKITRITNYYNLSNWIEIVEKGG